MGDMILQAQSQPSWEDVRKAILATSEQMQETDRRMQETDRRMQETDRIMKETAELVHANERKLERMREETDRRMQENHLQIMEIINRTEQQIEEANKRYGCFTNEFGKMVEDLCKPAALRIFKTEGIDIDHTYEGSRRERAGEEEMEVDALLCNRTEAVAVEVKTTCFKKDVDYFLKKMKNFKIIFHEFEGKKVYVAIAAMRFANGSDKYAQRKGLYVLSPLSEGMFTLEKPKNREVF
ncbi:MAG: hypothetical protein CW341_10235 [Bacteroidetes bacterium]|nr:hypothetical protein [Bacteroidota bacterium]